MQQLPTIPQTPQNPVGFTSDLADLDQPQTNKNDGWKSALSTVLILLAAPLVALALTAFVFQSYEVDGPSMETTLENHDRLIVLKAPRTIARITGNDYIPNRGDIIIFSKHGLADFGDNNGGDKQLIKRVIGLPGDRVIVKEGKLTVYNAEHPQGYSPDKAGSWSNVIVTTPNDGDWTIGEGQVFVCGDNRTNSLDSRYFGPVPAKDIIGKLVLRVFPIGEAQAF